MCRSRVCAQHGSWDRLWSTSVGMAAPGERELVRGQLPVGLQSEGRCPARQSLVVPETDRSATCQCKEPRLKIITTKQKQGYFSINSK